MQQSGNQNVSKVCTLKFQATSCGITSPHEQSVLNDLSVAANKAVKDSTSTFLYKINQYTDKHTASSKKINKQK